MRMRAKQFLTLAGLAALETMRQPICLLLTTGCVFLIACVPLFTMFNFGEDGKLARDSGLAIHFVFGLFLSAYAAGFSLSREIRSGTASAVLSKPVSREIFFLAKYAGLAFVVLMFSLCATTATLLAERVSEHFLFTNTEIGYVTDWRTGRLLLLAPVVAFGLAGLINYLGHQSFESTATALLTISLLLVFLVSGFFDRSGRPAPLDFHVEWSILPASALVTLALLTLSACATSLAARWTLVPTVTACWMIFFGGLLSDFLFGRFAETSRLAAALHRFLPNWQDFWMSDALTGGGTIPGAYVAGVALYAAVFSAGVLCLGLAAFRHTELG